MWQKHKLFICLLPAFLLILLVCQNNMWNKYSSAFESDVDQYYSYLPSLFIYKSKNLNYPEASRYWANVTEDGDRVPKTSIGMAYTYLPFFVPAYLYQHAFGEVNTGYEPVYENFAKFWGILMAFISLWLMYKVVLLSFSKIVGVATAYLMFFGTNILFYSMGLGLMAHMPLLILFLLIVLITEKLKDPSSLKWLLSLLFLISLAAIIRPSDAIIALYPGVQFLINKNLRCNLLTHLKKPLNWLWLILAAIAPILPQLLYWKLASGNWIVYSYGDEGFFFDKPMIYEFLLGFRKGWIIYTPLIIFSFLGLIIGRKQKHISSGITFGILAIAVFVYSSWWAWWYGGSYGSRTMVQYLSLLVMPTAYVLNCIRKSKFIIKIPALAILTFVVVLNLVQTQQYKSGVLHWDGMTFDAYKAIFMGADKPYDFYGMIQVPDYNGRKYTGIEYSNMVYAKSGHEIITSTFGTALSKECGLDLNYIQLKAYTQRTDGGILVLSATNDQGEDVLYYKKPLYNAIDNEGKVFTLIDVYVTGKPTKETVLKAYVYNDTDHPIEVHELELSAY